ncbi:MAG: XRE family transcriptional regulator [Fusobacteriaceae bacterium]
MEKILCSLKEKRKEKGYNQQNVSEMLEKKGLKLDASNLSRYESGKVKKLDPKIIKALCEIYNISYIETFEKLGFISKGRVSVPNVKNLSQENTLEMKVMAKASAGTGLINLNECLYTLQIKKNGFHKDCYLIEVDGNSMTPVLEDGAYVVVDPTQTEYSKNKIFVVLFEDKTYIKKIEIIEEAKILIMRSINPDYEDIYVTEAEINFVKIMGKAIHYFNGGKL